MDYNMFECSFFISISVSKCVTFLCLTLKILSLLNCAGCYFYPLQILASLQIM